MSAEENAERKTGTREKMSRRRYMEITGAGIAGLVVGGALGYGLKPVTTAPAETVTITETPTPTATASTAATTSTYSLEGGPYEQAPPNTVLNVYTVQGPTVQALKKILSDTGFTQTTNISINPVAFNTSDLFIAAIDSLLPTPSAPVLFGWSSGFQLVSLAAKGLVDDVSSLWDKHKDEYDPALRAAYSYKGTAYGITWSFATWGMMWYNPKTFKSLGIDAPPRSGMSWDDFLALAEELKSKSVKWPIFEPFVGWTGFPWLQQLIASSAPADFYNKLVLGQASYTDPEALFAIETFADVAKRGYFGDVAAGAASGYTMYPPPPQWENWWTSGQVGMILNGDWLAATLPDLKSDGTDYDFFWFPQLKPVGNVALIEGAEYCISKNCPDQQQKKYADELLDFFMTPQCQLIWDTKVFPQIFSNKKLPADQMTGIDKDIFEFLQQGTWTYLVRFWEATAPALASQMSTYMDKIAFQPDGWNATAQDMAKFADAYWKENPFTG
jgi:ABC-type glycerol-3-phosphate transport system substrate-binding protein